MYIYIHTKDTCVCPDNKTLFDLFPAKKAPPKNITITITIIIIRAVAYAQLRGLFIFRPTRGRSFYGSSRRRTCVRASRRKQRLTRFILHNMTWAGTQSNHTGNAHTRFYSSTPEKTPCFFELVTFNIYTHLIIYNITTHYYKSRIKIMWMPIRV